MLPSSHCPSFAACLALRSSVLTFSHQTLPCRLLAMRCCVLSFLCYTLAFHISLIHLGLHTLPRREVSPQHRVEVWVNAEVGFLKERFSFLFGASDLLVRLFAFCLRRRPTLLEATMVRKFRSGAEVDRRTVVVRRVLHCSPIWSLRGIRFPEAVGLR